MDWTNEQIETLLLNSERQATAAEYLRNDTYNILEQMQGVQLFQIELNARLDTVYWLVSILVFVQVLFIGWRACEVILSARTRAELGVQRPSE